MLKKLTCNRRYFSTLLTVGAVVSVLFVASAAHAMTYDLQQQIIDPNAPVDICPNIPGVQPSLPSGMMIDTDGNCYTPTPPDPGPGPGPDPTPEPEIPPAFDLCTNMSGLQATLPAGYYRTTTGECYAQTAPAADVCPNIAGLQSFVPPHLYMDSAGNCVEPTAPLADVCPNIPGPQTTLPDGMKYNERGDCYTPLAPTGTATTEPYTNTPSFLLPLVYLVPEPLRDWLRGLEPIFAKTVPFYVFGLLALLILFPLVQSLRESYFVRRLLALLKREREIADEKDTFIALASHHLRTPLTIMTNGVDTMTLLGEVPRGAVQPLLGALNNLKESTNLILKDIAKNTHFKNLASSTPYTKKPAAWRSPFFWIPVILAIVFTLLANFLLNFVGDKHLGSEQLVWQILVAAIVIFMLYAAIRNHFAKKRLREQKESLMKNERAIDEARNLFIEQTVVALQTGLADIDSVKKSVEKAASRHLFDEGYAEFQAMLNKFLLLKSIQTVTDHPTENIRLKHFVQSSLDKFTSQLKQKRISVKSSIPDSLSVRQNRRLFAFVVDSVLDNAIKYTPEGGNIELRAKPNGESVTIEVADSGEGIEKDKLGQLFKPFSRITDQSTKFNYNGLGFSLFLDKIIMKYTGGSIKAASRPGSGTRVSVTSRQ